ncbi:MAG: hypothetical protein EP330_13480 [Deltaproteobacteria bacterium]|nr:MAG: hypothetical protein EP330_13480 [Deltaproteobacteria bacterium]
MSATLPMHVSAAMLGLLAGLALGAQTRATPSTTASTPSHEVAEHLPDCPPAPPERVLRMREELASLEEMETAHFGEPIAWPHASGAAEQRLEQALRAGVASRDGLSFHALHCDEYPCVGEIWVDDADQALSLLRELRDAGHPLASETPMPPALDPEHPDRVVLQLPFLDDVDRDEDIARRLALRERKLGQARMSALEEDGAPVWDTDPELWERMHAASERIGRGR